MRRTPNTRETFETLRETLAQAARHPDDAAYHVSGALHAMRHALTGRPLTADERDVLILALAEARAAAAPAFADGREPQLFADGVGAALALVVAWAEPAHLRTLRGEALADVRARLRIAQNLAHNASLLDEIAQRARSATVRGLLSDARRASS